VRAFVFVDSDRNNATGGAAVATEINPSFTSDPTPGGYDFVVEVAANSVQLWNWQGNRYMNSQPPPPRASAERGVDTDPIRVGASSHGYIQASIDLGLVNLTQVCDANLYFRTVNDSAAPAAGDLDVGQVGACVAGLNGGGVPNVLVPPNGCQSNAECPAGGVCQNGQCALARACTTNADCGAGMQCTPDGRCVPAPTGTCTTNADCNGLICQGGQCVACTLGGNQCGAGSACSADGHCTVGGVPTGAGGGGALVLTPDEEVKGGACHCTLSGGSGRNGTTALGAAVLALLATRRRSARRR
jgi:Cys-rich repeat protein